MIKKIITTTAAIIKEIALFVREERAFLTVALGILAILAGGVYLVSGDLGQGPSKGGTMMERNMKRAAAERAASQQ